MDGKLKVSVLKFEISLYEGEAYAVSSLNERGPFDVLPAHTNFITLVNKHIVIHETETEKKEFEVDSGIMKVINNTVTIFLGIGTEQTTV